jgi:hypothetical protein
VVLASVKKLIHLIETGNSFEKNRKARKQSISWKDEHLPKKTSRARKL